MRLDCYSVTRNLQVLRVKRVKVLTDSARVKETLGRKGLFGGGRLRAQGGSRKNNSCVPRPEGGDRSHCSHSQGVETQVSEAPSSFLSSWNFSPWDRVNHIQVGHPLSLKLLLQMTDCSGAFPR